MGVRAVPLTCIVTIVLALTTATAPAAAGTSNKWRLECSGNAESAGEITLSIEPKGAAAIEATIAIAKGTSENRVAKTIRDALKLQLPPEAYKVEVDDGEDVLVKKKRGAANFGLKVVSNTVKGVRLNPDKE